MMVVVVVVVVVLVAVIMTMTMIMMITPAAEGAVLVLTIHVKHVQNTSDTQNANLIR